MLPVQVRSFYDYLSIDLVEFEGDIDLHNFEADNLVSRRHYAARRLRDQIISKYEPIKNVAAEANARERFDSNIKRARVLTSTLNQLFGYVRDTHDGCSLHHECDPGVSDSIINDDDPFGKPRPVIFDHIVETASYDIWRLFHNMEYEPNFYNIADRVGLGSGSNLGALGTTYLGKLFCKPLTATSLQLVNLFRSMCKRSTLFYAFPEDWATLVPGSQVTFVPKTLKTHRVVCTEPTINMLLQKGLSGCIREGLLRWGINFETQQDINRERCRIGSLTGEFATIDLSDASDCITAPLVRKLTPFFNWCELTRSPSLNFGDKIVPSPIFCTMGNDWTFPLQTLIFLSLARSVCRNLDLDASSVCVFGDDIILPTSAAPLMISVLEGLGFIPNRKKTFFSGSFRESCGVEYLRGYDIRSIYIKSLTSLGDLYSCYNRLNLWSHQHGIPVQNALTYIRKLIGKKKWYLVPLTESPDSGIWHEHWQLFKDENQHEYTIFTSWCPSQKLLSYERLMQLGFTQAQLYNVFLQGSLRAKEYVIGWPSADDGLLVYPDLFRTKVSKPTYSHRVVRRCATRRIPAGFHIESYNQLGIDCS